MRIICFEGIDGSGKTLQIDLLEKTLLRQGRTVQTLSFPIYESFFGREIGGFLSASGNVSAANIDPKSMALWYAIDRLTAFKSEVDLRSNIDFLLINRYTLSSIVFQSARGDEALGEWVRRLEHDELGLPIPDLYVILDVPPSVTSGNIDKKGIREYIDQRKDVYEADTLLQKKASEYYRAFGEREENAVVIQSVESGEMRAPEDICFDVVNALATHSLLA